MPADQHVYNFLLVMNENILTSPLAPDFSCLLLDLSRKIQFNKIKTTDTNMP